MKKLVGILLILAMLLMLVACGKEEKPLKDTLPQQQNAADGASTEEQKKEDKPQITGTTLKTNLWTLIYQEEDGWVMDEEDLYDDEDYSEAIIAIPGEEEDSDLVNVEIRVSIDDPYSFRDMLTSYGFDEYAYAEENAYDFVKVGGIDCLKQEGNYWGSPCLRYFNRIEPAGATVFIEIVGEYEDSRVAKLLEGLTVSLTDIGNEDGPWYWEGEPFQGENHSAMAGTITVNSEWIPITDCLMTKETFDHAVAVVEDKAYVLCDGALKQYAFDGSSLVFETDIALEGEYTTISAANDGTIWLSEFMEPLIGWKDGAMCASYEGPDYGAMHPSGSWGISYFSSGECEKFSLDGGAYTTQAMTFAEVETIAHLQVDDTYIYVCGYAAEGDGAHRVFVYDHNGQLKFTLDDADKSGLGSITFVMQTANGFIGLDGNMREVVLWNAEGNYIGHIDDGDLFGTDYPWFCGAAKLSDGSILAVMTEDRADMSAMELVAFRLSGF